MDLYDLIYFLEQEDPARVVAKGLGRAHSYRGYYDQLAFEPKENVTIGDMLKEAKGCEGRTFTGYKGGDFTMGGLTIVWLAHYGNTGDCLSELLLRYLFADTSEPGPDAP